MHIPKQQKVYKVYKFMEGEQLITNLNSKLFQKQKQKITV